MSANEKQSKPKDEAQPVPELQTEGPLAEKDQQGIAIERHRKLAEIAIVKWRRLKEKIKHQFKK